jgi:two-component system nitrate/nitrite response regulator NarL
MSRRQAGAIVPLGLKSVLSTGYTSRLPAVGLNITAPADQICSIVIIDPQTLFRRGLALLVRQWYAGASVFDVVDIAHALTEMGIRPIPKLLLVDAHLASQRKFAGLDQLVSRLPSTPVILLADELDWHTAVAAIDIGARAYVSKAASEEIFRHALALAASGEIYLPRGFFMSRAAPDEASRSGVLPGSPLQNLTLRQKEVLSHLVHGRSNKEIARCLGLIESTVKVHMKTILKKLAAANRTQAAMLAVEMGWPHRLDASLPARTIHP